MSVNKIYLLGRLTKDPEYKLMENGRGLCQFSIATNHDYTKKDTGERVSKATFHNIRVWGTMAKKSDEVLKKGSKVFIEGKQEHEQYESNNGEKKYYSYVTCKYIQFLDAKEEKSFKNENFNV